MNGYDETIDGWLTEPEAKLLDKYNTGAWCEIGSWKGKSTRVLASKHHGYAIDWFKGNPESTDIAADTYKEFMVNTQPYRKNITLYKLKYQTARQFIQEPFDLLFLDAEHSYQATEEAFELYQPLLKEGGVLIFHDVWGENGAHENTPWQPVTDFVMDFMKEYGWKNIENADRSAAFRKPRRAL